MAFKERLISHTNMVFIIYVCLCLILIALSNVFPRPLAAARGFGLSMLTPLIHLVGAPVRGAVNVTEKADSYFFVRTKNMQLEEENKELSKWQHKAKLLEAENENLRKVIEVATEVEGKPYASKVLSDATSPFARSIIIKGGKEQGISNGQEVINSKGLVGRVVEVYASTARVLLATDYNFRLPVQILENNVVALASGNNSEFLEILLQTKETKLTDGMTVVTSGTGGMFTSGISVGKIKIKNGKTLIKPSVDFSKLSFISVQRREVKGIIGNEN